MQALEDLANALSILVKTQAMQYVKAQIIKQTVLAAVSIPPSSHVLG